MNIFEVRSDNGLILHKNDLVTLTGEEPKDTVINYVNPMRRMLNNNEQYRVQGISHDPIIVSVDGWNWDRRNITKVIKNTNLHIESKTVLFNPDDLDI